MCGRYSLSSPPEILKEDFGLSACPELNPRYNIAPSQDAPVIRQSESGERTLSMLHWGLIPSWAKDPSIGNRMINARAETVAEKPSYRTAYKRRRCIIPADGFFEWKQTKDGKQPYYIHSSDHSLLGMAGLWERWERSEQAIESFTIITTVANEFMQPLHERMPVILNRSDYEQWLNCKDTDGQQIRPLLRPISIGSLEAYTVRKDVNNPANDTKLCTQRLSESAS